MLISLSIVSFLIFFNGKGVICNGEENIGLTHLPNLKITTIVSTSFNLWMFHDGVDTFAIVIIFLNET
jgi:hypothetical protein